MKVKKNKYLTPSCHKKNYNFWAYYINGKSKTNKHRKSATNRLWTTI